MTSSRVLSTGQSLQPSNGKCFTFPERIFPEGFFFFFFEQDGTLGTGGGHWKGVNVSLRENRIGHGADADLKRGT